MTVWSAAAYLLFEEVDKGSGGAWEGNSGRATISQETQRPSEGEHQMKWKCEYNFGSPICGKVKPATIRVQYLCNCDRQNIMSLKPNKGLYQILIRKKWAINKYDIMRSHWTQDGWHAIKKKMISDFLPQKLPPVSCVRFYESQVDFRRVIVSVPKIADSQKENVLNVKLHINQKTSSSFQVDTYYDATFYSPACSPLRNKKLAKRESRPTGSIQQKK